METTSIYNLVLVFHIVGLTLTVGASLCDFVISKQFWKLLPADKPKSLAVAQINAKIQPFGGIGFLLLLLSGITLVILTKGVYGSQLWMRVKLLIIVGLILNSIFMGRRNGKKLRTILMAENTEGDADAALMKIKGNLKIFRTIQLVFFLTIFVLAVFKFN